MGRDVHRAHSGYRDIVNSYESYEHIQLFLFGNIKAEISLENITLKTPAVKDVRYFYDFEFLLSIRGTGVYLQRRQQDPCENAIRYKHEELPGKLHLHTAFLNSKLKNPKEPFSCFAIKLRVVEHRSKGVLLWDHEYPERPIYNETLEIGVEDTDASKLVPRVQFRWLSDGDEWKPKSSEPPLKPDSAGIYCIPLRAAEAFSATLAIKGGLWPDNDLTKDTPAGSQAQRRIPRK